MPIYPKILKDPQFNLDAKQRRLLLRRAQSRWFNKPSNVLLYMVFIFLWMALIALLPAQLKALGPSPLVASLIGWLVVYPLMFIALFYLFYRFRFLKLVYQELRTLGHDLCPECGYTLKQLPDTESRCPECGTVRSKILGDPTTDSAR